MINNPNIVVVGGSGLVGSDVLSLLAEKKIPYKELRACASADSVGEFYQIGNDEVELELLKEGSFADTDIAVFAATADLSRKYVPEARSEGAICVDLSGAFSSDPAVPLVSYDVNPGAVKIDAGVITCPCSATSQLLPVLSAIDKAAVLKRVVVSCYHPVSSAGKDALDELWGQLVSVLNQRPVETDVLQHQIAFNCIPQVDVMCEDGYSREEKRVVEETRKVLGKPDLSISVAAARVPVLYGLGQTVNIETLNAIEPHALVELLTGMENLRVYEGSEEYPMPLTTAASDDIHVGRIRRDPTVANGLNLWIVADNVRRDAALNAVQIIQSLVKA